MIQETVHFTKGITLMDDVHHLTLTARHFRYELRRGEKIFTFSSKFRVREVCSALQGAT